MLYDLKKGQSVFNKAVITDFMLRRLSYSHEIGEFGGSYPVGTNFHISEINRTAPQKVWLVLESTGGTGKRRLKVTKKELDANFKRSRG